MEQVDASIERYLSALETADRQEGEVAEVGDDLLQGLRLAAKILHLVGGRSPRRVASKPLLAGLKELLRPAIVHR